MKKRYVKRYRPAIEPLERKLSLSAGAAVAHATTIHAAAHASAAQVTCPAAVTADTIPKQPTHGFLVYRITNPSPFNNKLTPPFGHVLVQNTQPIPGQVYNILQIAVYNGTRQTFDASSGFQVRLQGQPQATPILTGNQVWKPGQDFIFYVLTKKYYPIQNTDKGFIFDLGNAASTAIPGPSAIFLRVKYNPATFLKTLDHIVQFGPGAQGGIGIKFGLPDTAIYAFVSAKTRRNDFGGYF
jgi:hypothetical protein